VLKAGEMSEMIKAADVDGPSPPSTMHQRMPEGFLLMSVPVADAGVEGANLPPEDPRMRPDRTLMPPENDLREVVGFLATVVAENREDVFLGSTPRPKQPPYPAEELAAAREDADFLHASWKHDDAVDGHLRALWTEATSLRDEFHKKKREVDGEANFADEFETRARQIFEKARSLAGALKRESASDSYYLGLLLHWVMDVCFSSCRGWSVTERIGRTIAAGRHVEIVERHNVIISPEQMEGLQAAILKMMLRSTAITSSDSNAAHAWICRVLDESQERGETFLVCELAQSEFVSNSEPKNKAALFFKFGQRELRARRAALFCAFVIWEWMQGEGDAGKSFADFQLSGGDGDGHVPSPACLAELFSGLCGSGEGGERRAPARGAEVECPPVNEEEEEHSGVYTEEELEAICGGFA